MKKIILVTIEFTARVIIGVSILFIIINLLSGWYGIPAFIIMILWMLNPVFEYKQGGE